MGSGPTDVEDRVVVLEHVELLAQWLLLIRAQRQPVVQPDVIGRQLRRGEFGPL